MRFLAGFFFLVLDFFAAAFLVDFLVAFLGLAVTFLDEDLDVFFLAEVVFEVFLAVFFLEVDAFFTVAFFVVVFFAEELAFLAPPPALALQNALTLAPSERVKART